MPTLWQKPVLVPPPSRPPHALTAAACAYTCGRYRAPRPSGAPGVLVSKMVHLIRPSARDLEAAVFVTSDASSPERAMLALVNPTRHTITKNVTVPFWYTGMPPGTRVHVAPLNLTEGAAPSAAQPSPFVSGHGAETHALGAEGGFTDVVLHVRLRPASYAVLLGSPLTVGWPSGDGQVSAIK